jgi:hypothetical protein
LLLVGLLALWPNAIVMAAPAPVAALSPADPANALYDEIGLEGVMSRAAFIAGVHALAQHDLSATMLAIADMTKPSTARRLVVVDLASRKLMLQTWVAHGQGSGGLVATRFSNRDNSHATSLGLYRVGSEIRSPRHGPALLLEGLDPGLNDHARAREVIIHSAKYVTAAFIAQTGRLGRSWGCPAVSPADIGRMIDLLAGDGLLFIYGG